MGPGAFDWNSESPAGGNPSHIRGPERYSTGQALSGLSLTLRTPALALGPSDCHDDVGRRDTGRLTDPRDGALRSVKASPAIGRSDVEDPMRQRESPGYPPDRLHTKEAVDA